jgi:hypothetical protein
LPFSSFLIRQLDNGKNNFSKFVLIKDKGFEKNIQGKHMNTSLLHEWRNGYGKVLLL